MAEKIYEGKIEDQDVPGKDDTFNYAFTPSGWGGNSETKELENGQHLTIYDEDDMPIWKGVINLVPRGFRDKAPKDFKRNNPLKQKGMSYKEWAAFFTSKPRLKATLKLPDPDDPQKEKSKNKDSGFYPLLLSFVVLIITMVSMHIMMKKEMDGVYLFAAMVILVPTSIVFWRALYELLYSSSKKLYAQIKLRLDKKKSNDKQKD